MGSESWQRHRILKHEWMEVDGMILSKDKTYCLDNDQDMTDLVNVILDKKANENEPPIAAKFLCRAVFLEFTAKELDMVSSHELIACGQAVAQNWQIADAVKYVVES